MCGSSTIPELCLRMCLSVSTSNSLDASSPALLFGCLAVWFEKVEYFLQRDLRAVQVLADVDTDILLWIPIRIVCVGAYRPLSNRYLRLE